MGVKLIERSPSLRMYRRFPNLPYRRFPNLRHDRVIPAARLFERPAGWEAGDTAGLETCGTLAGAGRCGVDPAVSITSFPPRIVLPNRVARFGGGARAAADTAEPAVVVVRDDGVVRPAGGRQII